MKNAISAGLVFGVIYGILMSLVYDIRHALIAAPIAAFLFGLFIYFFSKSKRIKQQTEPEGVAVTEIIHSGPANHFFRGLASGESLYLLTDKLIFKSHNFNAQKHQLNIELDVITEVGFYNTMGLVPNGLFVIADGSKQKFVVNDRKFSKAEIERVQGNKHE